MLSWILGEGGALDGTASKIRSLLIRSGCARTDGSHNIVDHRGVLGINVGACRCTSSLNSADWRERPRRTSDSFWILPPFPLPVFPFPLGHQRYPIILLRTIDMPMDYKLYIY